MSDLIEDIALARSFPGLRRTQGEAHEPLVVQYIRDLTPADVEVLNTVPLGDSYVPLKALRATHHSLARLLASGVKPAEAAATTGHSISRVNAMICCDRAFIDLIEHYKGEVTRQYIDVHARLAVLGLATIEELQERLEVTPGQFTNKELFALAELTFDRSIAPSKGTGGRTGQSANGNAGVNVNVTFVSPKAPEVDESSLIEVVEVKALPNDAA